MRGNSLIFKGIAENGNEGRNKTEATAREFVNKKLQITMKVVQEAHCLGKNRLGFDRPIIVKYLSHQCKENMLRNASKLKPKSHRTCAYLRIFQRKSRGQDESYGDFPLTSDVRVKRWILEWERKRNLWAGLINFPVLLSARCSFTSQATTYTNKGDQR